MWPEVPYHRLGLKGRPGQGGGMAVFAQRRRCRATWPTSRAMKEQRRRRGITSAHPLSPRDRAVLRTSRGNMQGLQGGRTYP